MISDYAAVAVLAWLALEASAQLPRLGILRMWHVPWLPGGRGGIALHPLAILVARKTVEEHEAIHARQMARYTWAGFLLLYGFSGRWRARLEAEAFAAGMDGPTEAQIQRAAARIRGRTYFRSWYPGRDPGQPYVVEKIREALT